MSSRESSSAPVRVKRTERSPRCILKTTWIQSAIALHWKRMSKGSSGKRNGSDEEKRQFSRGSLQNPG